MRSYKWEVKYNGESVGKKFFTKKECKIHWLNLYEMGLYGYTVDKI